ncbi:glutathione synthase [Lipomyces chichibuensis]|uniref:glutathione synthase n=1 Tax=Lipomyces chichibuensis TaxID=1546026 RepID=UPI0033430A7D
MSTILNAATYPPTLTEEETANLAVALRDWSLSHGLIIRAPADTNAADEASVHVPLTLHPSPFPKNLFDQALGLQTVFNELYAKVADDSEFLTKITTELADVDDFMSDLWKLYLEVDEITGGVPAQALTLGLFRSDYLLHTTSTAEPSIRQVELNTISASFGGLSSRAADCHRFLRKSGLYGTAAGSEFLKDETMPVNPSARGLAKGLGVAHNAYGVKDFIVLFVVQPRERNAFDQRWLEYYLLEDFGVLSVRASLEDIAEFGELDSITKELKYKGRHVAVVYYRAGYTPADYTSPATWGARKKMELSKAIKCPSLATHFAGAKKVQQVLIDELVLAKFVPNADVRDQLKNTFVDILPLDDSELGKKARELIETCPEKYVLKPQREGGGNNVYREKIPGYLKALNDETLWRGYILMELIEPPQDVRNAIIRAGKVTEGNVISELGVFGCVLWDSKTHEIKQNFEAGWLLRTKFADSEEGGVAAGFGSIDSVLLI